MIKGKTPEEIRKLFNIQNDFSPEEEAQIRKENVSIRHQFPCKRTCQAEHVTDFYHPYRSLLSVPDQQEWAEDR
jgi:hypothetical protein